MQIPVSNQLCKRKKISYLTRCSFYKDITGIHHQSFLRENKSKIIFGQIKLDFLLGSTTVFLHFVRKTRIAIRKLAPDCSMLAVFLNSLPKHSGIVDRFILLKNDKCCLYASNSRISETFCPWYQPDRGEQKPWISNIRSLPFCHKSKHVKTCILSKTIK
jgi:hypothetical protein